MPKYSVMKRVGVVGTIETTTSGKVSFASNGFQWALGKPLATLSEWCHRKHMTLVNRSVEAVRSPVSRQSGFVCGGCHE